MEKRKTLLVKKPWGKFEQFTLNEVSTVKILTVKPGQKLSYQSHKNRNEFWRCLCNDAKAVIDDKEITLHKGDEVYINKGDKHRLIGLDKTSEVLEISFGFFDEDDITRHKDDYGRSK